MRELRIHTIIQSHFKVYDASGRHPFSILFGLCRRSDKDPRPLLFETAGSAMDVPYALANGLLEIKQQDPQDAKQWLPVDLSRLNQVAPKESYCLSLSSPINRKEPYRKHFTLYHYEIHEHGPLASILKPGKKYAITLASKDLGVILWTSSDGKKFVDNGEQPSCDSEPVKLVNSKPGAGKAEFAVVESLSWPPTVETRIRLCVPSSSSDTAPANAGSSSRTALEVSVINHGSDAVTVQTRGHQRFLIPWGLLQPEPGACDNRMSIIDATAHTPPTSSLQVVHSVTGEVVRENNGQRGIGPLMDPNTDKRPKAADVVTLNPEVPYLREIDLGAFVDGLVDGKYTVQMRPERCRWWPGEVEKEEGEDGRVPAQFCRNLNPPLMLESQDKVELRIRDGTVKHNM
ncbi:hypothetical protein HO133_000002 [Letharia lupina]|uniref:Uncharacterized protein n=1 Tax=Letharia lupina TaxID=560253 RepID=A0A8H6L098_9LECA|nr:uncharacterized protein HO133_000002 [Letharia lupina]KAF6230743.1 hypothetical protein HO133_000002 [Letharia lupina]